MSDQQRPPFPPFDASSAAEKARKAEDAWNGRDPVAVSRAYTENSVWRNRSEFFSGRAAIVAFLTRKWEREHDYRLIKEVWAFHEARISARFAYEWRNGDGQWYRSHGNEQWAFDANGLMSRREASINDVTITQGERLFTWQGQARPADFPGLSALGL